MACLGECTPDVPEAEGPPPGPMHKHERCHPWTLATSREDVHATSGVGADACQVAA
jgi:hypothetical protein